KGPPNYLVILVDDLGYMDITPNNPDSFYQTPNLERLAAEGIRFDNGYAANPVCSPSRYALVTGRDPTRVNATDWFHHRNGKHREGRFRRAELLEHLPHSETTLPEALAEAGYGSAFIGKWHLGEDQSYWPENQGFDINIGGYSSGSPRGTKGYFAPYKNPRLTDGEKGEYLTERLTDEAIGLLDSYRQQQQPFLLYLSYYTVHNPLGAPAETVSRYQSK
ncbi:MAG: sulfatase-like hydrolase/transferase, partial [Porticoccaceae bacterium]|nr:sulfatase-like hydrolase/transferase [Porticoccaceae bacterium]